MSTGFCLSVSGSQNAVFWDFGDFGLDSLEFSVMSFRWRWKLISRTDRPVTG